MSLLDLGFLYLLGGLASAVAVWRRDRSLASGGLALVLWPLWVPFTLFDREPVRATRPKAKDSEIARRIAQVIEEARQTSADTPFEAMLGSEAAARIVGEVERAAERLAALDEVLTQPSFQRDAVLERLAKLERDGASQASLRTARLHLESVERLTAMRARQAAALVELEQVVTALRSQLVVARYAGSMEAGVDAIVGDLWARVEGLGEALDATREDEAPRSAEQRKAS